MTDIVQRSPEWYEVRRGKVTASRVHDATAKTKAGKWYAARANYMAELVAERMGGNVGQGYQSSEMKWGIDHEPGAKAAYAFRFDAEIAEVGFAHHPTIEMSGASPDGLIGLDGMLQIKCLNTANHIDILLGEPIAAEYFSQVQWEMACAGRQWCDFVSFDPRLPEEMRLFVKRVQRDQAFIDSTEATVREFLAELSDKVAALSAQYGHEVAW